MTSYYQCVSCAKTSAQENCVVKTDGNLICPHCLDAVKFAFVLSSWTAIALGESEPSFGYCDGCDELEAELYLMDGDWLCDKCKATGVKVQENKVKANENKVKANENKVKANENKTTAEALGDLEKDCADHWEMIKASVFITLFLVWVCFAIWSKYVS